MLLIDRHLVGGPLNGQIIRLNDYITEYKIPLEYPSVPKTDTTGDQCTYRVNSTGDFTYRGITNVNS